MSLLIMNAVLFLQFVTLEVSMYQMLETFHRQLLDLLTVLRHSNTLQMHALENRYNVENDHIRASKSLIACHYRSDTSLTEENIAVPSARLSFQAQRF